MANLEDSVKNDAKIENHSDSRVNSFMMLVRNEILGNIDLARRQFESAYPQDCKKNAENESDKYGDKK
jgi:hypothetical protein